MDFGWGCVHGGCCVGLRIRLRDAVGGIGEVVFCCFWGIKCLDALIFGRVI